MKTLRKLERCTSRCVQMLDGEFRLKYRDLYLVTIGFIILGLGVALLNRGGSITFFIFPFFLAGDLAPILMVSSLFIVMMFFWWVNKNWMDDTRFTQSHEPKLNYLRVDASCQFCGNPLPVKAAYCSSCGNSVDRGIKDSESF